MTQHKLAALTSMYSTKIYYNLKYWEAINANKLHNLTPRPRYTASLNDGDISVTGKGSNGCGIDRYSLETV